MIAWCCPEGKRSISLKRLYFSENAYFPVLLLRSEILEADFWCVNFLKVLDKYKLPKQQGIFCSKFNTTKFAPKLLQPLLHNLVITNLVQHAKRQD